MRDLYDRMVILSRQLAVLATSTVDVEEHDVSLGATFIELPDRVYSHLERQMAFVQDEWQPGTSFDPLKGEMKFNGISINRGRRF